jgi:hypothetical protein
MTQASKTAQPAAPTVADLQKHAAEANDLLMREVFVPVFLQKMAALGYVASSDDEACSLLQAAEVVSQVPDEELYGTEATKQASVPNRFKTAVDQLYGVTGMQAHYDEQLAYQKAAELVQSNPNIAQAAVLLHVLDNQQAA